MTSLVLLSSLHLTTCVMYRRSGSSCTGTHSCTCNKAMTVVDCSKGQLTHIPNIPDSAVSLNLDNNNLTSIQSRAFSKLTKLQVLNLNHNFIEKVEPFAFEGLDSIIKIGMRKNQIRVLADKSFANVPSLTNLSLAYNKIENISTDVFDGTSGIIELVLDGNKFLTVPFVGYQPNLRKLGLYTNIIENCTFPAHYWNGSKELVINLSENKITKLENRTFSPLVGSSATELILTNNKITTIAAGTFTHFQSLASLTLGSNALTISAIRNVSSGVSTKSLTQLDLSGIFSSEMEFYQALSFFENTTIEVLTLNRNSIQHLKDNVFKEFKYTKKLHLSKNTIYQLHNETLTNLHALEDLGLNNNMFTSFPKHLPTSLKYLTLRGNWIKVLRSNAASSLHNLTMLYLGQNVIDKIEDDAFNGLVNLQKLQLNQNKLGVLSGSIFKPLIKLTYLDLADNNLHQIFQILFQPLKSLRTLNLSGNKCARMQANTLNNLTSLRILHLERNELSSYFAGQYGAQLFSGLTELRDIRISSNNIQALSDTLLTDQVSLEVLKLDHNLISGWGSNLFKYAKNLTILDISYNQIPVLSKNNFHNLNNAKEISLKNNPFVCNCDLLWFREWMDRTSVQLPYKHSYKCHGPEDWQGKLLTEFTKDKISCKFSANYVYAIVGSVLTSMVSVIFIYRNRWRLRLRLYLLSKRGRLFIKRIKSQAQRTHYRAIDCDGDQYLYDAYISCNDNDYDWVMQHLLPGVDNGRYDKETIYGGDFKLYFDPRDCDPGKLIRL